MDTEKTSVIDWSVYGALLRNKRMKSGFKNMDDFIKALWFRARVKISRDTMYKIEQGKVPPSIELYWGINIVLFGTRNDQFLIQMAVCDEWKDIEESNKKYSFDIKNPYVPYDWTNENRINALSDSKVWKTKSVPSDDYVRGEDCVYCTGEPISVFEVQKRKPKNDHGLKWDDDDTPF